MNLVDDVNTLFQHGRGIYHLVPQVSDIVYAVVAGSIDLQNVGSVSAVNGGAGITAITGISVDGIFTVDGLRQDLCRGGLTGASGSAEQICVGNAVLSALQTEDLGDMLLSRDLVKGTGSPFSVQCLIHGFTSTKNTGYAI
jgi:hypothetical protein